MKKRFLPSLDQVRQAAKELPDPAKHDSDQLTVGVKVGSSTRDLVFTRIKFNSGSKGTVHKWVYDGKVLVGIGRSQSEKKEDDGNFRVSFSVR